MTLPPISFEQILFILFAAVTLGAALYVVLARDMFHAALWLVLSLFGVAALYMLLQAAFIAGLQLFVYIGGITVLIVIVIMVTRRKLGPLDQATYDPSSALIVCVLAFVVLAGTIQLLPGWGHAQPAPLPPTDSLVMLGEALVDPAAFALPFELASVLLLAVLVGSLYLAREQ